jgi:hypothetical protein
MKEDDMLSESEVDNLLAEIDIAFNPPKSDCAVIHQDAIDYLLTDGKEGSLTPDKCNCGLKERVESIEIALKSMRALVSLIIDATIEISNYNKSY